MRLTSFALVAGRASWTSKGYALAVLVHNGLVGASMGVDFIVQGVKAPALDLDELVDRDARVECQGGGADDEERGGVVRGWDRGDSVSELRDRHDEHDPQAQGLGAVLQPGAALDEERGNGAGEQKGQAAVSGMVGDAVIGVGEVPQVVGDDPGPDHIGPDHVTGFVARDKDAKPAADSDDVEDARDAVHDVPGAGDGPQVLDGAAFPQAKAEDLEIA